MTEPVPPLRHGESQVWWASTEAARPALAELLDDGERERLGRFLREQDRARYLAAHALARLLLAPHVGIPPADIRFTLRCGSCGGPHGKPAVAAAGGPELSISHSGQRVAVALSRSPVGVDVEYVDRRPVEDELVRSVLAPPEQAVLARLPAADRRRDLLAYWTRKEALVKATGEGLTVPLTDLTVSAPGSSPRLLNWRGRPGMPARAHLAGLTPGPGHLACVAVLAATPPAVVELDGDPLLSGHPAPPASA